ncbi:MAG: carbamate kinase, partial [Nitrospinales bacterium]
ICLQRGIEKKITTIITQVVVDANDPAFQNPSRPIGPFYSSQEAEQLRKKYGWVIKEDAGRGYRRFIPSPEPLEIVEKTFFQELINQNFIVIGAGGGGIPVIRNASGELRGVEAVIDKDKTSALLASELEIDCFVILTQVDHVFTNFNTPNQKPIQHANVNEIESLLKEGHFLEGSMKPKMESVVRFLKDGGKKAIVAHLYDLIPAMEEKAGTLITPVQQ